MAFKLSADSVIVWRLLLLLHSETQLIRADHLQSAADVM
jgi:hypothetical protein